MKKYNSFVSSFHTGRTESMFIIFNISVKHEPSSDIPVMIERDVSFRFLGCPTADCTAPAKTLMTSRPTHAVLWSNDSSWETPPRDGDDLVIKEGNTSDSLYIAS